MAATRTNGSAPIAKLDDFRNTEPAIPPPAEPAEPLPDLVIDPDTLMSMLMQKREVAVGVIHSSDIEAEIAEELNSPGQVASMREQRNRWINVLRKLDVRIAACEPLVAAKRRKEEKEQQEAEARIRTMQGSP